MAGVHFTEVAPAVDPSPNRADVVCFVGFTARRRQAVPRRVGDWLKVKEWRNLSPDDRKAIPLPTSKDEPGAAYVREWLLANGWPKLDLKESKEPGEEATVRTPLPPSAKEAVLAGGWRQRDKDSRDDDDLLHIPVLLETFESFHHLFEWESRAGSGFSTWLGAAVRSFFAQGGARCYVVRADDPPPPEPRPPVQSRDLLQKLIPSYDGGTPSAPLDQANWRGLEILRGLEETAFVCLPDVPELVRDAAIVATSLAPPAPGPEEFVECSDVAVQSDKEAPPPSSSPACRESGFQEWFKVSHAAATFVRGVRRDVELILAVPLPAEGSRPRGDLLQRLAQTGLSETLDQPLGIASAFLQLVYPWLATDGSSSLPGGLEPPDGVFAGAAARTIATFGAHRSLARQPLHRISRFYPKLPERDYQLLTPRGEAPALIHRVSLVGPTPNGPGILSDITTSLSSAHRPAGVGRLTAAIVRTARQLGDEFMFEASGPDLWRKIESRLNNLLSQFYRAGALLGESPEAAFSVRCDATTMTQNDQDHGRLLAIVEFAPAHPVGIITVTLSLQAGATLMAAATEGSNV